MSEQPAKRRGRKPAPRAVRITRGTLVSGEFEIGDIVTTVDRTVGVLEGLVAHGLAEWVEPNKAATRSKAETEGASE